MPVRAACARAYAARTPSLVNSNSFELSESMAVFRRPITAASPNGPCPMLSHIVLGRSTDRMLAFQTQPAATFLRSTMLRSRVPSASETVLHAARPTLSVVSNSASEARGLELEGEGTESGRLEAGATRGFLAGAAGTNLDAATLLEGTLLEGTLLERG